NCRRETPVESSDRYKRRRAGFTSRAHWLSSDLNGVARGRDALEVEATRPSWLQQRSRAMPAPVGDLVGSAWLVRDRMRTAAWTRRAGISPDGLRKNRGCPVQPAAF